MLFGVVLKFLGVRWTVAGLFFAFGLVLLVLWMPRLELYPSANASAPPIPPPTGTD